MSSKIYIALPVYNEWPALSSLVENLKDTLKKNKFDFKIVICDDGSTDEGHSYLNSLIDDEDIHLIVHEYNRGLAESIRDLFEYIVNNGNEEDILIRMDGDATHNPNYIVEMVQEINKGYDVVVASRIKDNDKNLSFIRRFLSLSARYFVRIFFKMPKVKEYTGGFRAYKVSIIRKALKFYKGSFIQLGTFGFVCTFEKLIKLNLINASFSEVPFALDYSKKTGESKMIPWITILGYIILIPVIYFPKTGWYSRTKSERKK